MRKFESTHTTQTMGMSERRWQNPLHVLREIVPWDLASAKSRLFLPNLLHCVRHAQRQQFLVSRLVVALLQ